MSMKFMLISLNVTHCQSNMVSKSICMKIIFRYMCDLLQIKITNQQIHKNEYMIKSFCTFDNNKNYLEILSIFENNSIFFHCFIDNLIQKERIEYMSKELTRVLEGELEYLYMND